MSKFAVRVDAAVSALGGGAGGALDENDFIDASRLVYDAVREIRRAVLMNRVSWGLGGDGWRDERVIKCRREMRCEGISWVWDEVVGSRMSRLEVEWGSLEWNELVWNEDVGNEMSWLGMEWGRWEWSEVVRSGMKYLGVEWACSKVRRIRGLGSVRAGRSPRRERLPSMPRNWSTTRSGRYGVPCLWTGWVGG